MTKNTPDNPVEQNIAQHINDSLIANINHALRTPLNGVVGMMALLSKTGLTPAQQRYAHVIHESTENLMLQLDNIMELAKIEEGGVTLTADHCRLRDVIKEAAQPLIPMAVKKHIPVYVKYDPDLPEDITVDRNRFRLVLTNLLSCSLKFAEKGNITLKVSHHAASSNKAPAFLRFTIENSKILHDTLYQSMQNYDDINALDLREFGEITVSLIATQHLLKAMGARMSFDNPTSHEPPFHFDLDFSEEADAPLPESWFSYLRHKRALIVQRDILDFTVLTQSLGLWEIDYHIIDSPKRVKEEAKAAYKEGRAYDMLFQAMNCPANMIAEMQAEFENCIQIHTEIEHDTTLPAGQGYNATLKEPLYPEELLNTLCALYELPTEQATERALSSEASGLLHREAFDPIDAHVLVVEDDFVSRLYAAELLEGFGCRVALAENGEHALNHLNNNAVYDLVLMDCMMPRMDGYRATRTLRDNGLTDIPVIALTANTLEQDKERCLRAGMNDYITKPLREQDLYKMLKLYIK